MAYRLSSAHSHSVLKCKKCESGLCSKDDLVLGTVPPSQAHLAVRPGNEKNVLDHVRKVPNHVENEKKAAMIPFKLLCTSCENPVGSISRIERLDVWCFKVEAVVFLSITSYGYQQRIEGKKLKQIREKLKEVGIAEYNLKATQEYSVFNASFTASHQPSRPLVYCDTSRITRDTISQLTQDAPRDYQQELFLSAMRGNSLVYLPTGSGKTLVAAMAISCMKQLNPDKLAVFVVDRIPLVYQQSEYLRKQLPRLRVKAMSGDMSLNLEHQYEMDAVLNALSRNQVDVLVLTHQLLLNNLADDNGLVRMSGICALVIDEAHHCSGNHPYNKIMNDYYFPTFDKYKPIVLALTASPAGDIDYDKTYKCLNELLSRLSTAACMSVNSSDLSMYTNRPDSDYQVIPLTPNQQLLQSRIEEFLQAKGPDLERIVGCPGKIRCFTPTMPNYRGALRTIIGQCHEEGNIKGHALGELMTHILAAKELNSVLGLKYAIQSLQECFKLIENSSTLMEKEKKLQVWSEYSFINLRATVSMIQISSLEWSQDKFQHLANELKTFAARTQNDPTSRGIIFVQMRKTAYKLCERLKTDPMMADRLKPTAFVGHGMGNDGMEWHGDQEETLKKFRSGRVKLLVSTSVLEEGLDVPVCNLIIRFDRAMSLKSLVQSRGRASRRSDSKFVILCSDDKEMKDVMELKQKEKNMDQAMRNLHSITCYRMSQGTKYACPVQVPDVSSIAKTRTEGSLAQGEADEEVYPNLRPITKLATVTIAVYNIAKGSANNEEAEVIEFFNENFNVTSLESMECKKETWSMDDGSLPNREDSSKVRALKFELHQAEPEEALASGSFTDAVIEQWCLRTPDANHCRSQAWLERLDVAKRKAREPVDLVAADSLKLGYFCHRTDYCIHWPGAEGATLRNVRLFFQHDVKQVIILFTVQELDEIMLYEMEVRYSELENFILMDQKTSRRQSNVNVMLSLKHPPRIYRALDLGETWVKLIRKDEEEGYDSGDDSTDDEDDNSEDEIEVDIKHAEKNEDDKDEHLADEESDKEESDEQESSDDDDAVIQVGEEGAEINTEQVEEVGEENDAPAHPLLGVLNEEGWSRVSEVADSRDAFGKATSLIFEISRSCQASWQSVFKSLRRWDKRVFYAPMSLRVLPMQSLSDVYLPPSLSEEVKYAVHCLLAAHSAALGRIGIHFGIKLSTKPPHVAIAALEKLNKILANDSFCIPEQTLENIFSLPNLKSARNELLIPGHCAQVRRLILTPTRTLIRPPEIMQKNRVLRKYDALNFLCVNIRDEDFSSLSSSSNLKPVFSDGVFSQVLSHLKVKMDRGIKVCGQQYVFLGCSNSQLRSHSCWFVKSTCVPEEIRRWMGDFTHIRCVGTYVSRMGQCFSTSMDTVGITVDEGATCTERPDIMTEDKGYTFSDGVGGISKELAFEVTKKVHKKSFVPSAFQIRFAGCKGVLAIDSSLSGKQLYYRPSMRKFESSHRRLEVIQTSRPQAVYLNHQVIMLLSNLGVPDEVFISLMRDALDHLAGTLLDERLAILQMGTSARTVQIAYRDLSNAGIALTVEPFFRSLVAAVYRDRLLGLLHKARIQLPTGGARLMMGVMDETGVLQHGQVFVQYSAVSTDLKTPDEFDTSDKRVLTGRVVVTRNPCLHPGDVRCLVAVDTPRLRHLVDCVVFPQVGPRPHPSEMGGGDLDGDLYFVCWHEPLIPNPDTPLHDAMDYKAVPKLIKPGDITSDDMTTFLMNYICSDQLGKIDNAHKAQADILKDGVKSNVCILLAEAHSYAVDAPKTGQWPNVGSKLMPKQYPDFMMKTDKENYRSQKLLGKLYRACRAFKRTAEETAPTQPCTPMVDPTFVVPGYEIFMDDAQRLYHEYCDHIDRIMTIYGISTEAELLTGCFRKHYNRLSRERTEVAEIVSKIVNELRNKFRKSFFEPFGLDTSRQKRLYGEAQVLLHQKVSAWYMVAYDKEQESRRCLSFPWLVDDIMASLRNSQRAQSLPRSLSLVSTAFPVNMASTKRNTHPRVFDLTLSLMSLLKEDGNMLLQEYKRRVSGVQLIAMRLRHEGDYHLAFFGSTATFLFQIDSDVDLCVIKRDAAKSKAPVDLTKKLSKKEQLAVLRRLHGTIRRLFHFTRLVDRARVPIIFCQKFKQPSPRGTITVPFDLSASREGILKASLVTSYIKSFPGLLPVLRFLLQWSHVTGLTGHRGHVGVNTNILVSMLLSHCISRGYVIELGEEVVNATCARIIANRPGGDFQDWENIICNLVGMSGGASQVVVTLNDHSLGEVLISFLASHSSMHDLPIPASIATFIGKGSIRELVDSRRLGLLSEHMQRAYHSLALRSDLKTFLTLCGSEIRQAIHLSTGVSCLMRGAVRQTAREMERKTGAKVTIRPKVPSTSYRLIVEARGTEFEVEAVEQLLQEITSPSGNSRLAMMSVCFVQGSSQMLFEDSQSDNDPVKLEPYKSHHHPQHDGAHLYTPMLATLSFYPTSVPPSTSHAFLCYQQKLLTQFQLSERDFDPSVHGNMEFIVHFGRVYIFRVPKSFIEDAEFVTIEMLQANLKKGYSKGLGSNSSRQPETRRNRNQEAAPMPLVPQVNPTNTRRNRKKVFGKPKNEKKKKLTEKPTRSSFFTVVNSGAKVETFLRQQGFVEMGKFDEFGVSVVTDSQDMIVKFDATLNFKELSFPNLRWCMSDVKRRWKENNETTSGNFDGMESDVRFMLQSRRALGASDIRETEYEKYQGALKPNTEQRACAESREGASKQKKLKTNEKMFMVDDEVWSDVTLIRHKKTREFRCSLLDGGLSNKSSLLVHLSEITEHSRPIPTAPSCFRKNFRRYEVSIEAEPPKKWTDEASVRSFLENIWRFSFALSSFLSDGSSGY